MENVNRHMESMSEEFGEMLRIKLYKNAEINKLIKTRKDLECKVNGVNKNLIDFKAYIKHEKDLLKNIKLRRDKLKIFERKSGIEFKILKRIQTLYEISIQKFPNDYPLSLAYFKFCKDSNNTTALNHAINNILKHYSQQPDAWILIAKYYAYEKNNKKDAINHLLKGLTIHKDSQALYREAFELLLSGEPKHISENALEDEIYKIKTLNLKIKTYLDTIFHDIPDINFYIELLEMLQKYPSTQESQEMIVEKLIESYSGEDLVWHTLAQRELNKLNQNTDSTKQILEKCFQKYQEGLKVVEGEKKKNLWHYYLDYLISVQQDRKVASKLKTTTLQAALEDACEEDILKEKHYIVWIELLDDKMEESEIEFKKKEIKEEIVEILEKGLESIPESVELWKLRLKAAVMKDNENEVNVTLKRGIQALNEKALPLWLMSLRFHMLVSNENKIDEFYQSAIYAPKDVCNVLKPQYILWLGMSKSIEEIRQKYNVLARQRPYCKELHKSMLKVEGNEIPPNIDELEKVHKNVCEQFGKDDVDIWIAYAQFLSKYRPTDLPNLYKQAESKLTSLLFPDFQERYLTLEEYNKISSEDPASELFNILYAASSKKSTKEREATLFPDYMQE
ncbi:unnamed protein product [Brassicogethes aeneus]|uniref:U3 small nucleolar RNA-associated protein 6 homolog n=1 Tax=Brassicogethes aeneus TaxID=1431903 RepID=A0A9P0FC28_BRAAE|nr:unnamed protein product [Brassicogethes aeneus]